MDNFLSIFDQTLVIHTLPIFLVLFIFGFLWRYFLGDSGEQYDVNQFDGSLEGRGKSASPNDYGGV